MSCVNDWTRSFSLSETASIKDTLKHTVSADEEAVGKDLIRASFYLVHEALSQLTPEDIEILEWHHRRYYDWMLDLKQKATTNELAPKSDRWAQASEGTRHLLIDKAEKSGITGELTVRIGKNLLPIMRRETAPLELMLEGGLLTRIYQQQEHISRAAVSAAKLIRAIADENPEIQILEIGAGTEGATIPMLEALYSTKGPHFKHLDFTDISPGFLQSARERLSHWGGAISFSTLDIEKDVEEQGFRLGSYDVILAVLVLHATKNMEKTMTNVRKLLKDGSKLVLVETALECIDVSLIFGSLPGWWLSEELERKLSPNMPLSAWNKVLRRTGFSGTDLDVWDCENEQHRYTCCILSTATPSQPPVFERSATIVYSSDSPPSSDWTLSLMERIVHETSVTPALSDLKGFDATGKVCIFLSGLNGAQSYDEESFNHIKALLTKSRSVLWVTIGSTMDCRIPENAIHFRYNTYSPTRGH